MARYPYTTNPPHIEYHHVFKCVNCGEEYVVISQESYWLNAIKRLPLSKQKHFDVCGNCACAIILRITNNFGFPVDYKWTSFGCNQSVPDLVYCFNDISGIEQYDYTNRISPHFVYAKQHAQQIRNQQAFMKQQAQSAYQNRKTAWSVPPASTRQGPVPKTAAQAQNLPPVNPKGGQQVPYGKQQAAHKCRIEWDVDSESYMLICPFSKEFVEFLKLAVPVGKRTYDPDTKVWHFTEEYFDIVNETANKVWRVPGQVFTKTKAQSSASTNGNTNGNRANLAPVAKLGYETILLEFSKLLPFEALQAAFRRAAMDLHPDKQNGSSEKMTQLNQYFDRIKEEKLLKAGK